MKYFITENFLNNIILLANSKWNTYYIHSGSLDNNKTDNSAIYRFPNIIVDNGSFMDIYLEAFELDGYEQFYYFNIEKTSIDLINKKIDQSLIPFHKFKYETIRSFPPDLNLSNYLHCKNELKVIFSYDFDILNEIIAYPVGLVIINNLGNQLLFSQHKQMSLEFALSLDNLFNLETISNSDKILSVSDLLNISHDLIISEI